MAAFFFEKWCYHLEDGSELSLILKNLQYLSVLIAAAILGNWYLAEYKKAKLAGQPWYRAFFSLPGILIVILIFLLPLIAHFI